MITLQDGKKRPSENHIFDLSGDRTLDPSNVRSSNSHVKADQKRQVDDFCKGTSELRSLEPSPTASPSSKPSNTITTRDKSDLMPLEDISMAKLLEAKSYPTTGCPQVWSYETAFSVA